MSEEYTMNKEIKPCMNDGCGNYITTESHGCNCNEWRPYHMEEKCPKYSDTPPPKPFTPKNPDDYIPGCTAAQTVSRVGQFACSYRDDSLPLGCCAVTQGRSEQHINHTHGYMCDRLPCYDPAPKPVPPKTRDYYLIKIPVDSYTEVCLRGLRCPNPATIVVNTGNMMKLNDCGIPCEIVTEEIDNEN